MLHIAKLVVLGLVLAVQSPPREALTNDAVIDLVKSGLSPSIVVSKIRMSAAAYDLSAKELVRLKSNGVSDEIIEAMMQTQTAAGTSEPPSKRTVLERNGQTDPGVYVERDGQLVAIEPNVCTDAKITGALKTVFTSGIAKTRTKAVVAGAHARLQVEDPRPVFYFSFDPPIASPNELVLVALHASKSSRELTTGEFGLTGQHVGASEKDVRQFDYEKVRPGYYRVIPHEPLAPGEYCFFYAGTAPDDFVGSTVFDFGVRKRSRP
jgi:hypothetical protein